MDAAGRSPGMWLCVATLALCACGSRPRSAAGFASDGGVRDAGLRDAGRAQSPPAADSGRARDAGDAGGTGGTPGLAPACVPTSCALLGVRCGTAQDGCGNVLECGVCPVAEMLEPTPPAAAPDAWTSELCGAAASCSGSCGPCERSAGACKPWTCADPGVGCDTHDDGCGGPLACGCELPRVCDRRNHACCEPLDCTDVCAQGAYDGSDGCGALLHCDACTVADDDLSRRP
jgi:hypothetical protein